MLLSLYELCVVILPDCFLLGQVEIEMLGNKKKWFEMLRRKMQNVFNKVDAIGKSYDF